MKLIGSKMENDFREELVHSHEYHFSEDSDSKLKELLIKKELPVKNAYILSWTPDQTEDIYVVLINGETLVSAEIDRHDLSNPPIFEKLEINEYMRGLSRMYQVKLLVAKDLASEKHNKAG
jgi:hypothetical protein